MEEGEIVRIEKWRVLANSTAQVTAPQLGFRLRGRVYGHPTYKDGDKLTTSEILKAEGNIVYCKSRRYLLGEPALEYVNALHARGLLYDPSSRFSKSKIMLKQKAVMAATLAFILGGLAVVPAQAWDAYGHMTVASVCYQRLTEHTKARVDALLKLNPMYQKWEEQVGSPEDKNLRIFLLAST
jgi:hypothetical protein